MLPQRKRSQLQEKRVAEGMDARVQKASGATDFAKGDVRKRGIVKVECKTTAKNSYVLKTQEIHKIKAEAAQHAESWAMQVEFQKPMGQSIKVAVIDWYEYEQLYRMANNG